jgi:hypothetical protein
VDDVLRWRDRGLDEVTSPLGLPGDIVGNGTTLKRVRTPWNPNLPPYDRRMRLVAAVVAVGCLAMAVAIFLYAVGTFWRTGGWAETSGTVVEVRGSGEHRGTRIRFQDSDGIEYTFRSEFGTPDTSVGTQVVVRYPPRDPDRAETSADAASDRNVGFVLGAIVATGGLWAAVWSLGLVGEAETWFEPDEWPPQSSAPTRGPRSHENWTRQHTQSLRREQHRVPLDGPLRVPAGMRCRACGRETGMQPVAAWRTEYSTFRCGHCLWWLQKKFRLTLAGSRSLGAGYTGGSTSSPGTS